MSDPRERSEFLARATSDAEADLSPDVAIEASAAADEVRHLEEPRVRLETTGAGTERHDHLTRKNIPDRVEPGRTYRDVRISRKLAARLDTPGKGRTPPG
jgi:hypothetical protein